MAPLDAREGLFCALDANGNLVFTTDFRSVYATVLDRWLGTPASAVLGGNYGEQAFLPPA